MASTKTSMLPTAMPSAASIGPRIFLYAEKLRSDRTLVGAFDSANSRSFRCIVWVLLTLRSPVLWCVRLESTRTQFYHYTQTPLVARIH